MATVSPVLFLIILIVSALHPPTTAFSATSPYLSPTTFIPNYNKMLTTFKIYIYTPQTPINFTDQQPLSLFHNYLLHSQFITSDPEQAQLYYIPFPTDLSSRSIARLIKNLRTSQPYWNRTLGADHFFVTVAGIESSSDRNIVELKKNSVQISIFPMISGNFIPHKDVTLPPVNQSPVITLSQPDNQTGYIFCYMKWDGRTQRNIVQQLAGDSGFVIESEIDQADHVGLVKNSKYCLFLYNGVVDWLVEAMAFGCVPVLLVEGPVQDMPLMDVLWWSDMVLVVGVKGGVKELKSLLSEVSEDRYRKMKRLAMAASRHLVWNDEPQAQDAFYMVVYQLWLRRHAIRYTLR